MRLNSTQNGASAVVEPLTLRLNPFAFPADTDFRFALLIVSVVGSSFFIWNVLHSTAHRPLIVETALACDQALTGAGVGGLFAPGTASTSAIYTSARVFAECEAPLERSLAPWMLGGAVLLLGVAGAIYWCIPLWLRRRHNLVPLSDRRFAGAHRVLMALSGEAGLARPPTFLLNPFNRADTGMAFGRLGRYSVVLNAGLVTKFYTDPPAFRAVLLHELAHVRNADVDKTYFAVAVWWAFVAVALVPFAFVWLDEGPQAVLAVGTRVFALTLLVYLSRNAVLRVRETYADVRAGKH